MPLPEQTIAWLRQAARLGQAGALAHLDHVEQLDALRESLETALKRITALERRFIHGVPIFTGPLPAGATWTEREGGEVFTARPAPCSAAEADEPDDDEPDDDEPQTLHTDALRIVDTTLAGLGVLPEIRGTLRRAIREPMEPAAAVEPIEPEAQPAEGAAPAGGLVEKIAFTAGCGDGASRAVIREVAAWLDCRGHYCCSPLLREQCLISQEGQANG
jgi:hypothetical protein